MRQVECTLWHRTAGRSGPRKGNAAKLPQRAGNGRGGSPAAPTSSNQPAHSQQKRKSYVTSKLEEGKKLQEENTKLKEDFKKLQWELSASKTATVLPSTSPTISSGLVPTVEQTYMHLQPATYAAAASPSLAAAPGPVVNPAPAENPAPVAAGALQLAMTQFLQQFATIAAGLKA